MAGLFAQEDAFRSSNLGIRQLMIALGMFFCVHAGGCATSGSSRGQSVSAPTEVHAGGDRSQKVMSDAAPATTVIDIPAMTGPNQVTLKGIGATVNYVVDCENGQGNITGIRINPERIGVPDAATETSRRPLPGHPIDGQVAVATTTNHYSGYWFEVEVAMYVIFDPCPARHDGRGAPRYALKAKTLLHAKDEIEEKFAQFKAAANGAEGKWVFQKAEPLQSAEATWASEPSKLLKLPVQCNNCADLPAGLEVGMPAVLDVKRASSTRDAAPPVRSGP
ncbi:MAG: hypothetical protein JWN51_3400 [Phycisphaerales bacterium]|nr:hypothetical protein [Phycisphaerales bacterium]